MEPLGTLKVGDLDFRVVRIRPMQGRLQIQAHHPGPAELAVPQAEWFAPDGSLVCVFAPFRVSEEEAAWARYHNTANVTVFQDIELTEVTVTNRPSLDPLVAP
jgi:hypothetical protein